MTGCLQHEISAGELEELTLQIRLMTDAQLDGALCAMPMGLAIRSV